MAKAPKGRGTPLGQSRFGIVPPRGLVPRPSRGLLGRPRARGGTGQRGAVPVRVPFGLHGPAGAVPNTGGQGRRIDSPPIEQFWRRLAAEIPGGAASATVPASGTVTVRVGPQGVGTRWYLTQANIQTTTGAADASTCAVYVGPSVLVPSSLMGSSYAGGQDTIGLNGRSIQPGEFVTAVWSGASPGDVATVVVYGEQQALTNWG